MVRFENLDGSEYASSSIEEIEKKKKEERIRALKAERKRILHESIRGLDETEQLKLKNAISFVERVIDNPDYYLGQGASAKVATDPEFPGICLKIVDTHDEIGTISYDKRMVDIKQMTAKKEAGFLRLVRDIAGLEVKIPKPILDLDIESGEDRYSVLVMETIKGASLKDLLSKQEGGGKAAFPENFDFYSFFGKLKNSLEKLHEKGIYHCDFHQGNIMVDDSGDPVIIDFGASYQSRNIEMDDPFDRGQYFDYDLEQLMPLKYPKDSYMLRQVRKKVSDHLVDVMNNSNS